MSLDTRNMTVTKIRITIVMAIQSRELRSDLGEIDLNIPRDRNRDFDPELVSKHTKDISMIEDKVISMYGRVYAKISDIKLSK